jgi:hypothetical protein
LSYRIRVSREYAYYEGYASWQEVQTAAKALAQKQEERSQQLFRGDPPWRYQRNIDRINADIAKLEEALRNKEAEKPLINIEPEFGLVQANRNGMFPAPPKSGSERQFAQNQKADAILFGEVREFHGRFFLRLRLFALYTNSFIYEDDIIFSMDDTEEAVNEIASRLSTVLSANEPAVIVVNTEPPQAQVLINQSFAGRGGVRAREHPPGLITVAAAAEGYDNELIETKLNSGEITEITVNLSPLQYADIFINVPGGASLYHGAFYLGEAPLNLPLPIDQLGYILAEGRGGQEAAIVFAAPSMPGETYNLSLKLQTPPTGRRRVNAARGNYYWAWGATWLAGMLAWGTYGISSTYSNAMASSPHEEFRSTGRVWSGVSTGALIVAGGAVAYNFFQLSRYLKTATEGSTPIDKPEAK